MAIDSLTPKPVLLTITSKIWPRLFAHLFSGDGDEHGAIIAAGVFETDHGVRLIAQKLFLAKDGRDYVPGKHGHRALKPEFIYEAASYCERNQLCYLAVHNHGGRDRVGFSDIDLESHERGYPALLDILHGPPVGALVFARNAVAADIWFSKDDRRPLEETRILGSRLRRLYAMPPEAPPEAGPKYDRQVMLFGPRGQALLKGARIGIIGVGGGGSIINQDIAYLGVGSIISADPKRIRTSNRSRIIGSMPSDLPADGPATPKVEIAERVARNANPEIEYLGLMDDFTVDEIARQFRGCDFLFLAADTMPARLVFNALVYQYGIPGIQVGAKITASEAGKITAAFSVARWVTPDSGCLMCNGLIPADLLAMAAKDEQAQADQTYGTRQENPSVITMNAVAAAHAVNDFLIFFLGLFSPDSDVPYHRWNHLAGWYSQDEPRSDHRCQECGDTEASRAGMGNSRSLPTFLA